MSWLSTASIEIVSDGGTTIQRSNFRSALGTVENFKRSTTRTIYTYPGLTLGAAQGYVTTHVTDTDVEEINYGSANAAGAYTVKKVIVTYGAWTEETA